MDGQMAARAWCYSPATWRVAILRAGDSRRHLPLRLADTGNKGGNMGLWSVLAVGRGFLRPEGIADFELYGVVSAYDSGGALTKAIDLAARHWPEIAQGHQTPDSGAAIHAEAIDQVALVPGMEVDVVDVSWI